MRSRFLKIVVAFAALAQAAWLHACQTQPREHSIIATGTETNWLRSCSQDAECGALACECGVCTRRCSDEAACSLTNAVCRRSNSPTLATLCGTEMPTFDLCLPACDETCAAGQVCVAGACIPAVDASGSPQSTSETTTPSETAPSETMTTSERSEIASNVDSSSNSTQAVLSGQTLDAGTSSGGDSSLVTSTVTLSTQDAQTTADAGSFVDANLGCPLDTRPLTDGCCYLDTDCDDGQVCYQAACSGDVMAPGRCAVPPTAPNCYSERDCNTDEVCQDGLVALCGTTGPHTLGTCVLGCDYDSCHPERCDEVGETCCDPFPGDGPNYCNAELECLGSTCEERAETTTPEALAQQACEETGGNWDFESCGHYACGQPPNCDAIIPGCNCGLGRSFDTLGCYDDPQCTSP